MINGVIIYWVSNGLVSGWLLPSTVAKLILSLHNQAQILLYAVAAEKFFIFELLSFFWLHEFFLLRFPSLYLVQNNNIGNYERQPKRN